MHGLITWKDKDITITPMNNLINAVIFFTLAQGVTWAQSYGQFLYPWWKKNPLLVSFTIGGIASYLFIKATYYAYVYFDGMLWPSRFIGFSVGIIIFALLTWIFMNEGINLKTIISLFLSMMLLAIQIFWK
jgi:hypothetical protein